MSLITCRNLSIYYENRPAVDNVSFIVEDGDYICIIGENGSGKSTLVKAITGQIPISSGDILFSEINKNQIGYLPQQTVISKDFPASVFEVVLSGCLNKRGLIPFYSKANKLMALINLEKLSISEIKNKPFRILSGGQQQRVLLARALCATEKLIILDEPAAGLDPVVTCEFYCLLKDLNKKDNITVIMVSHDIATAVNHASKILHLDTSILFYGNTGEYKKSDAYRMLTGGKPE